MKAAIPDTRAFLSDAACALYLRVLDGQQPAPDEAGLDELAGNGLLTKTATGRWNAEDVDEAVRTWQTGLRIMAGRLLDESQSVPGQLRDLGQAYRRVYPAAGQGIEYVHGTEVINKRLNDLVAACTEELLTAQRSGPRPAHVLVMSYERDLGIRRRGAQMRTIYLPTAREDGPTARWAATMTENGAAIRTAWDFGRVIIIDRRTAVAPVMRRGEADQLDIDRAMFVTDEAVVQLLVAAFERDWARAEAWDGTRSDLTLSAEHRKILAATADGLEQEDIADQLNVARRTVAKRMAEIREITGSRNLAQLMYWWAKNENQV